MLVPFRLRGNRELVSFCGVKSREYRLALYGFGEDLFMLQLSEGYECISE